MCVFVCVCALFLCRSTEWQKLLQEWSRTPNLDYDAMEEVCLFDSHTHSVLNSSQCKEEREREGRWEGEERAWRRSSSTSNVCPPSLPPAPQLPGDTAPPGAGDRQGDTGGRKAQASTAAANNALSQSGRHVHICVATSCNCLLCFSFVCLHFTRFTHCTTNAAVHHFLHPGGVLPVLGWCRGYARACCMVDAFVKLLAMVTYN